jgi:hypothetical protein
MRPNRRLAKVLGGLMIFLAFLGVAVAARRAIVLFKPGALSAAKNPAAALDAHFAGRRTITLTHILPGMFFMILGPLQFIPGLRARHPGFHRWPRARSSASAA